MSDIECPKCEQEYEACGSHEDDSVEWKCDECGFAFNVLVEYDPIYSSSCVEHEYGEFEWHETSQGKVEAKICKYCNHCVLKEAE